MRELRFYDENQSPVILAPGGRVFRMDSTHRLAEAPSGSHVAEDAIELSEDAFLRRFHQALAHAYLVEISARTL